MKTLCAAAAIFGSLLFILQRRGQAAYLNRIREAGL